jgi:hypothetical protein
MLLGQAAFMTAALFAGAAFYVSAVEHPARMALDPKSALTQWKPGYERGALMQASLAVISGGLGLLAAWMARDWRWLVGAALILAPWPYTMLGIMPTNRLLKAAAPDSAGAETRAKLETWGRLHAGRTALGVAAMLAYLWALN